MVADNDPDDEIGYYAVAGIALALSKGTTLFGEAKYTRVELDDAEIELDGLGANAGLMVTW